MLKIEGLIDLEEEIVLPSGKKKKLSGPLLKEVISDQIILFSDRVGAEIGTLTLCEPERVICKKQDG